jgi:hypothetical protein
MHPFRIFLLSPAHCGGKRADILLNGRASFPLAVRLRSAGVTLGEAFSFLSGLYFRGKLTYADRFARPPRGNTGVQVITTDRGLMPAGTEISNEDLRRFAAVDISPEEPEYRRPLERDVAVLGSMKDVEVILLGSVATGKYVDILLEGLGDRLLFPADFVGRGDMSRGALLLQAARNGVELSYQRVHGAVRRGRRAPRIKTG